jgi:uncharacterized membrane protein
MKPDPSTPKRSLAKALSWETTSTIATFGLAWIMFGQFGICVAFAGASFAMKLIMFYWHERLWHQIPWGKVP